MPKPTTPRHRRISVISSVVSVIVMLALALRLLTPSAKAGWFDDSYSYRQLITFTHNAAITSARAVTFSLDTAELITANLMQSDCDDVRFTDQTGKLLRHQQTGSCNNAATTYEVELLSINNGTNANAFYVYYSNPTAASASDITVSNVTALTPSGGDPASTAPTSNDEQGPAPTSYWKMDDASGSTVQDSSYANNNDLTITNATWKSSDLCISGSCLAFDGSGDHASKTYSSDTELDPGTGGFTVSGWFKHTSTISGTDTLISRASGTLGSEVGYKIYMNSSGFICFGIDASAGSFPNDDACTSTSYADSQWHKFMAVKNGTTNIVIYIDGRALDTQASITSSSISGSSPAFRVGIDSDGTSNGWDGFIDEVKYYPFAITNSQINTETISQSTTKPVAAVLGTNNTSSSALSSGLVGYWKMDESSWATNCSTASALDASGNNNHAKPCPNASAATLSDGKFGPGGSFDGTNDYVNAGTTGFSTTNATFAMWIKPSASMISANRGLFDTNPSSNGSVRLITNSAGTRLEYSIGGNANSTSEGNGHYTISAWTNEWHHLAVVVTNSNTTSLFVDGVKVGNDFVNNVNAGYSTFDIGRYNSSNYYAGIIDDVRVYNRSLSPGEISQLYNWAPPPGFYFNADTNTGTTVYNTGSVGDTSSFDSADMGWTSGKYGSAVETFLNSSSTGSGIGFGDGTPYISSTSRSFTISGYFNIKDASGLSYWFGHPLVSRLTSTNSGGCSTHNGIYAEARSASTAYIFGVLSYQNVGSTCNQTTSVGYGTNQVTIGQWNHITLTFNGSSKLMQLYMNGSLIESATWGGSGDWTFADTTLFIGNYGTTSNAMGVALDEIKIYTYVRNSKQIIEDMNAGHPSGGSPISSQLVYYKMDESNSTTLNNSNPSQSSVTASVSGASWLTPSSCKNNTCLNFDGTDDVATITNTAAIDLNDNLAAGFSVSTWFYADTDGENDVGQIFQKGTSTYCRTDSESASRVDIECSLDLATSDATLNISSAVATASWNHLVVSYTDDADDEITVWINGRNVGSSTNGSGAPAAESSNLLIGGTTTANFDGRVDEFKIYNSELVQPEVLVDLNFGSAVALGGVLGTQNDEGFSLPNPQAWWKLDNNNGTTTSDSSGNSFTSSTFTGPPQWSTGKFGSGLSFDGTNSVVRIPEATATDVGVITDSYTISAWFKTTTNFSGQAVIVAKNGNVTSRYPYELFVDSTEIVCFDMAGTGSPVACSSATYNDGKWHHVVGVRDVPTDKLYLYIDGVLNTSTTDTTTATAANNDDISIGNGGNSYTQYDFTGQIDDVRFYNSSLTATQIAYLFNRGKPTNWYAFDECNGLTAYDTGIKAEESSTRYNGTISIGASGTADVGSCGTASTSWGNGSTGKYNSSISLDGTDDYITIPNGVAPTTDFTYSMWVNLSSVTDSTLLESMATTTGNTDEFRIHVASGVVQVYTNNNLRVSSTRTLTTNTWTHLVVTRSGSTITIYLNGIPEATTGSDSGALSFSTCELVIGQDPDNGCTGSPSQYTNGMIDELKIYNYALTTEQVKKDMNQQAAVRFGPQTGLP